MFQIAYNYPQAWPQDKPLLIDSHVKYEIPISPNVARRKANGFLAGYVSMMALAGQPTLILSEGEPPLWRVPATLRLPKFGEIGLLGMVEVNAQTGQLVALSHEQIVLMQELAHVIVAHFTMSATPTR